MNTATRDKFSANYSARTPKEAIALILTKGKAVINAKNNLPPTLGALEAMYLPYTMDFEDRTWTIRLKDSMVRIEPDRAVEKPVVKVAEKEESFCLNYQTLENAREACECSCERKHVQ